MFSGVMYIFFGFLLFFIPVIGWILGWIFIIVGFIKIIIGIVDAVTPNAPTEQVIIRENIVENTTNQSSMTEELEKLSVLFEKGHITEEEFNSSKKRIIKPYDRS